MKILIDDEKTHLPDGSVPDVIIRSWIGWTQAGSELVWFNDSEWYLDHDLGETDENKTGYTVICQIEDLVEQYGEWILPKSITCVSNNGAGRQRIQLVIDKLYGRL